MFKLLLNPLFHPNAPGGTAPIENKEMSIDAMEKALGEDTDTPEIIEIDDKPAKKAPTKKDTDDTDKDDDDTEEHEEETKEEDELVEFEEEDEPTEDKLAPSHIHATRRQIEKDYPGLFKKYPSLQNSYYRDAKFTELFPTVKEAEQAALDKRTLDDFEEQLLDGNTEKILKAVKGNPQAFNKIADSYLETLQRVDENAYTHVMGNVLRNVIKDLYDNGTNANDEALKAAAVVLNRYYFNTTQWSPPTKLSGDDPKVSKEEEQWRKEQRQVRATQLNNAQEDLTLRVDNTVKASIEKFIDPKESMTDYVRKVAVKEAMDTVYTQLENDTRFKAILGSLWRKAASTGYSKSSLDEIKSAFLARSKPLMGAAIIKARNEALKGMRRVSKEEITEDDDTKPAPKGTATVGRSTARASEGGNKPVKGKVPPGMSTYDFLSS